MTVRRSDSGSSPKRLAWMRVIALFVLGLQSLVVELLTPSAAFAQVSVVGASSSTSSTSAAGRKSFFNSASGHHWVFWYTGSGVAYASSSDGVTWTQRGTLAYDTPNFSVAFRELGGTPYVFVVTEANTYDVVIHRGTVGSTSISFESAVTVLDGSSASDKYILPHVALDTSGYVWTAAFHDLGAVGERYPGCSSNLLDRLFSSRLR